MSRSFGRLGLPCVLGGLGTTADFFVIEAGIGSMPFGALVEEEEEEEAIVGMSK